MDLQQLIDSITPEIYQNLKQAIEIGKWPDGTPLTASQREHSLQAVIAYDARHKSEDQRVGYIDTRKKTQCGDDELETSPPQEQPLKWQQ